MSSAADVFFTESASPGESLLQAVANNKRPTEIAQMMQRVMLDQMRFGFPSFEAFVGEVLRIFVGLEH